MCALTCAAAAAPASAQDGGGLGNLVGSAVQQVAGALPQVQLPQPSQAPAPVPAAPAEPAPAAPSAPVPGAPAAAPEAPAAAAPKPAEPSAVPPAPGGPAAVEPAGASRDRARPAPLPRATAPAWTEGNRRASTRTRHASGAGPTREHASTRPGAPLFGQGGPARGRPAAKASLSGAQASHAAEGSAAPGARSGASGAAAARAGDPAAAGTADSAAVATADPVATGAQTTGDSSGTLPFTGFGVLLLAAIGFVVLGAGLLLRRTTRRVTRAGA